MRAVCATKEVAACFDPMADDFAAAMIAFWRQCVDGTLEAIEVMRNARDYDF
jgi:hypothetical protein